MALAASLRLADRLSGLSGRRRLVVAALLGICGATALPPVHVLPGMVVSLTGLVWLLDGAATRRQAFLIGWAWGVGYFSAGMYWIANAFLVDAAKHAVLIPLALLGIGAGFGVLPGVAAALARLLWTDGVRRIILFACVWTAMEWVRGWFLTGFPWNWPGYVWDFSDAMMQSVSLFGVLGLSLLTVLLCAAPAALRAAPVDRRAAWGPTAIMVAVFSILWGWGAWRLDAHPQTVVDGVTLRLVQGNIPQAEKWDPDKRAQHLMTQAELSRTDGYDAVTHVIWPETAAFYSLDHDERARAFVAAAAPPNGMIIVGAPRTTPRGETPFQVWNSLFAVTAAGGVVATYDKAHLVPFGEYVPDWLPFGKMTAGSVDFTPGPGPRTLAIPGAPPVGPMICYEIIFPGAVVDPNNRPGWLLNLTNDGWYGVSSGPYQHYAIARARAIEEGLPVVRSAGTGISGVIDPLGRTVARIPLNVRGVADSPLPRALEAPPPFARLGHAVPLALIAVLFAAAGLYRRGWGAFARSG